MHEPTRIAMWSGPRNISTALMRSWGSREDTAVTDEPLYAHYLSTLTPEARAAHPAADEVMRSQPTDWREVVATLTGPAPDGKPVWYQKHMAHHLTPQMDREWVLGLVNCFLIRDPAEMIPSYIKVISDPRPADLGLPQQVELFDFIRERSGRTPPVIDSRDVLEDPRGVLSVLCGRVGIAFDEAMLSWAPGPRPGDGVWAPHWYAGVYESSGFTPYRAKREEVPEGLSDVLDVCRGLYERLASHKIMGGA
ncbi:MAG: hypothetical protein R3B57_02480 [Phycisphaerales bacterium]